MARVEVVNAQSIDGVDRVRGEVFEVPAGRARDLIAAGKVRVPSVAVAEAVVEADVKAEPKPAATKGGK